MERRTTCDRVPGLGRVVGVEEDGLPVFEGGNRRVDGCSRVARCWSEMTSLGLSCGDAVPRHFAFRELVVLVRKRESSMKRCGRSSEVI